MEGRGVAYGVSCGVENIFSKPGGSFSGVVVEVECKSDPGKRVGGVGLVARRAVSRRYS